MGLIINPRQIIKDGVTSLRDVWSSSKVSTELSGKQATLVSGVNIKTINTHSLLGSGDIHISGGGDIPKINMTATTATLDPNKFYVWGEVASLDISLAAETAGIENIYKFQFQSGDVATTLTLPSSVKWSEGITPTIFRNTTYIISIESGIAKVERMFTSSLLPAGYQQVEWIESDGTACIRIPFDFSQLIESISVTCKDLTVYPDDNNDYISTWSSFSHPTPGLGIQYAKNSTLYVWVGSNIASTTLGNTTGKHTITYDNSLQKWMYDDYVITSNYTQTSISTFNYIGIWAPVTANGTVASTSEFGKICDWAISTVTSSIHLIPCYQIQSGAKGLYDIISDTFYTNFRSSGDFNIGPDV